MLSALLILLGNALPSGPAPCPAAGTGLTLPPGFCATRIGDKLGGVRQMAVSAEGVLYAAVQEGGDGHGVLVFADTGHRGEYVPIGAAGAPGVNDVELHDGYLYAAYSTRVVRWPVSAAAPVPAGEAEVVVSGLPGASGHRAKSIALKGDSLFVNFGSATNSCQQDDRQNRSPGVDPCTELETRAGIWVFSASRAGQTVADGRRYATGLRNTEALAFQPGTGALYAAVMGRDQLAQNWGYSPEVSAENPAEEFGVVTEGADYGWPYCYYSNARKAKVLAPEYGGDGMSTRRCGRRAQPLIAFPGHWAPLALAFYAARAFGPSYEGGVFVAFHGSWNRAPLPQAGYRVVFIPFRNGKPTGRYETFATGDSGPTALRASGVAVGPDGALFISDDRDGRIWRVVRSS